MREGPLSRTLKSVVRFLALVAGYVLAGRAAGAQPDSAAPALPSVFETPGAPLDLTIRTDLRTLIRDRGDDRREHKGILRFPGADGGVDSAAIELRTRGNFRRRPTVCSFPPLRLTLGRRAARGTPFAEDRSIKLVTHCRPNDQYEQYVLQEYLIYRTYALLTELSLRTRLARVTYEDLTGREKPMTRYAILIEDERRLAERREMRVVTDTGMPVARLDPRELALLAVFQYFIGNTDWSVRALHNIILLADSTEHVFPVAYDFDWSGVIGTRYAQPDTSLPIRTVQERLFSGYCGMPEDFSPVFAKFRAHRAAIDALYDLAPLEREHRERARRYYAEFYRQIDDPRRVKNEMLGRCP
jgi:hypothetical protein